MQAFRILDKDQKGYLTKQDLLRVLATVPPEAQDEEQDQHLGNGSSNNSTGPQRNSSISHHSKSSAGGGGGGCGGGGGNSVHSVSSTGDESNKALQEAIRLQRIHEKVDHILTVADMNRDGVIR
jgi:hypothetical protein